MKKLFFTLLIIGLAKAQLAAADKQTHHSRRLASESVEAAEEFMCTICQRDIDLLSLRRHRSLPCNHMFHATCIEPWTEQHNTCPTCRTVIDQNRQQEFIQHQAIINLSNELPTLILEAFFRGGNYNDLLRVARTFGNEAFAQEAIARGADPATPQEGGPTGMFVQNSLGQNFYISWATR